jgi:hypothetical protein
MRALLQCGHMTNLDALADGPFLPCPRCNTRVHLQAVECRLWFTCCQEKYCRYKYWSSMRSFAEFAADAHRADKGHTKVTCDYVVPDEVKEEVRELYGRKVAMWINDGMVEPRYPKMRSMEDVPLPPDDEEVPF